MIRNNYNLGDIIYQSHLNEYFVITKVVYDLEIGGYAISDYINNNLTRPHYFCWDNKDIKHTGKKIGEIK